MNDTERDAATTGPDPRAEERRSRLLLACVSEPADRKMADLVAAEGAVSVWRSLHGVRRATLWGRRVHGVNPEVIAEAMQRHRLRYVIPGDPEWPERLDDLAFVDRDGSGGAPLGLWVAGEASLAALAERSVALVGSRASTRYGESVAADLAADLAGAGVTVISGGAYGIDITAHSGALAGGGPTIAVLAGGLDSCYPRGNTRLLEEVRRSGLLISELPPGARPSRLRFLGRNRVIAALALCIVVVEAATRSGAKNTAMWGNELSRDVLAVPGSIHSVYSAGCHQLVRDEKAKLVTSAAEIREVIAPLGQDILPLEHGPARRLDILGEVQRELFEHVPGRAALATEELAVRWGRDLLTTIDILGELEELGFVMTDSLGRWKLRPGSVG